jgi:purine nucleoside permease
MNGDGVLGICTGIGTARAAASIMALGLDPRFDLRKAYWVVAGIAGIDPEDGTPGSYELPRREPDEGEVYRLEPSLVDWAFRTSRDVALQDSEAMREQRAKYASHLAARSAHNVFLRWDSGTWRESLTRELRALVAKWEADVDAEWKERITSAR